LISQDHQHHEATIVLFKGEGVDENVGFNKEPLATLILIKKFTNQ